MKDNLEAKFYDQILKNTKKEIPTIERIEFEVDRNIDNLSTTNIVDCATFYKTNAKAKKAKKTSSNNVYQDTPSKNAKSINDRYTLDNFIV